MSRRSLRLAQKVQDINESHNLAVKNTRVASSNEHHGRKRARKTTPDEIQRKSQKIEATSVVKEEKGNVVSGLESEKKYIGAHVSISGGIQLAVSRALDIGAKSFAMFLRSQRQWSAKPLSTEDAQLFRDTCKEYGFPPSVILPHGIYLMNCGSPDEETLLKSRNVLVDELQRCEMLGLTLYNFHPGSTCGKISVEECLDRIGKSINLAHEKTKFVVTVLENMSCQGNTVMAVVMVVVVDW